jgi:hypothetical protein
VLTAVRRREAIIPARTRHRCFLYFWSCRRDVIYVKFSLFLRLAHSRRLPLPYSRARRRRIGGDRGTKSTWARCRACRTVRRWGYPLPVRQPRLPPKKAGRGGRRQSRWLPCLPTALLFEPLSLMPARRFPPPWRSGAIRRPEPRRAPGLQGGLVCTRNSPREHTSFHRPICVPGNTLEHENRNWDSETEL